MERTSNLINLVIMFVRPETFHVKKLKFLKLKI